MDKNNNNKQDNLSYKEEMQNLLSDINILEVIYNLTLGILLRQSAKRRFLSYIYTKYKEESGEETRVTVSILLLVLKCFIIEIFLLFTLFPTSPTLFIAIVVVLNVVVSLIYKVSSTFTSREFLNVAKTVLSDNALDTTFKESFIFYHTPLLLNEYADALDDYLKSNLTSTHKTKTDRLQYTIIDERYARKGTAKYKFLTILSKHLGKNSVLEIKVRDNLKRDRITSINDYAISHFKIIPILLTNQLVSVEKSTIYVDVKAIIDEEANLRYYDFLKTAYAQYIKEFKDIADEENERRELEAEKARKLKEEEELNNYIAKYNLPPSSKRILQFINKNKEELKFSYWNINAEGIQGTNDYIKIRCKLLNNTPLSHVKSKKGYIESGIGKKINIEETLNDSNSFYLTVITATDNLKDYKMTVKQLSEYNNNDKIFIGKGVAGTITADFSKNALFPLIGGKSGSGKSVVIMGLLAQILNLNTEKFGDLVVVSGGKVGDYTACQFDKKGALIKNIGDITDTDGNTLISEEDSVKEVYNAIRYVEKMVNIREAIFAENRIINISDYNSKNPENTMKRIALVIDEWESMKRIATKYKHEETKKTYADTIESSIANILSKGRSSGTTVFLATQDFTMESIGKVRKQFTVSLLGRGDKNTWSTFDQSGEIANYFAKLMSAGQRTEGVFFYKSDVLKINGTLIDYKDGFSLIKTPYIANSDIAENLNFNCNTAQNYEENQKQASVNDNNTFIADDEEDEFL